VEAEFEVVGVKKIGCEPKDFETLSKLDFLALLASNQTASCSVQEGVAQEEFELPVAEPAGYHSMEAVWDDLKPAEYLASATAKFREKNKIK
jgi:hypothetical protein